MAVGRKGEGRAFCNHEEVLYAIYDKQIDIHAKIKVRVRGKTIETTAGRIVFNQIVPEDIDYCNELLNKKRIQALVGDIIKKKGNSVACAFLDQIKALGYEFATKAGITFGAEDLVVPSEKDVIVKKSLDESYSNPETVWTAVSSRKVNDTTSLSILWTHTTGQVADALRQALAKDREGFNPVYLIAGFRRTRQQRSDQTTCRYARIDAKTSKENYRAVGEIIENPITSNF